MSSQSDPRLNQAQRLIETEQFQDARALLLGILRENPRDTRALFLYALAASNREEAIKVLNRLLELDPLHQQAKNVLAQIEGRSIQPTGKPPQLPVKKSPQRKSGYDPSVLLAMVAVIAIVGAAIALLVAFGTSEDEVEPTQAVAEFSSPTRTPSDTPTPTDTPDPVRQATFEAVSRATLPSEWTPVPSPTQQPTRTPGPPLEIPPSDTPVPTFTPTQPEVAQITINLQSASRLFAEYYDLSAQVTSLEDSRSLDRIAVALDTIIESIEISNYDSVENDPVLVDYLEEFIELLEREQAVAERRAEFLDLEDQLADTSDDDERDALTGQIEAASEDLEDLVRARLEQLELVESRLRVMNADAVATTEFVEGINRLRTPTSTPIIVPPSE